MNSLADQSHDPQRILPFGFVRGTAPSKWINRWAAAGYSIPLDVNPLALDLFPTAGQVPSETPENDPLAELLASGGVALVRAAASTTPATHPLGDLHAVRLYVEQNALLVAAESDYSVLDEISATSELSEIALMDHALHLAEWPAANKWEDPAWLPKTSAAVAELVATGTAAALLPLPLARNVSGKKEHKVIPITSTELAEYAIFAVWLASHNSPEIQDLVGVLRGRKSTSGRDKSKAAKNDQNLGTEQKNKQKTGKTRETAPAKQGKKASTPPPNSRGAQLAAARNKGRPGSRPPKPSARRKKR